MTLHEQQQLFVKTLGWFLTWASDAGYDITMGECWRSPATAAANAAAGTGIANSLHTLRLACDINLFVSGALAQTRDEYQPLGAQWKSMHALARWGGDFSRPDADHFSLEWEGVQ